MADAATRVKIIAGEEFEIPQPYSEGRTITAVEAKVLNQVYAENIGNNMRETVKKALVEGTLEAARATVLKYANEYQFTVAGVGRGKLTPEEREARKIARDLLKSVAHDQGKKLSDFEDDYIESKVDEYSQLPDVVAEAKRIVKARSKSQQTLASQVSL